MKKSSIANCAAPLLAAAVLLAQSAAARAAAPRQASRKPNLSSYNWAAGLVSAADRNADAAWLDLRTRDSFLEYGAVLRERMAKAIGGLPAERAPLDAKTLETLQRDGYTIEKVLYQGFPGVHIPALVFVPDPSKFKPPYPAFAVSCGHSGDGKGMEGYRRACVLGAKAGFVAVIYDPFGQGERTEGLPKGNPCVKHNRIGSLAALLGGSMARFRIWDAMRTIDYLRSRPDVDGNAIGMMGNSGGGTMTSLAMALDGRIKAAAPSCYISNVRVVCSAIGPQDAEQVLFGQLEAGINHLSLVLMNAPLAVRIHCAHKDFFPLSGTIETSRKASLTASRFGFGDRYALTDVPGPHGWKESTRVSSVRWMENILKGCKTPVDVAACRKLDEDFDLRKADCGGLSSRACSVVPGGDTSKLPGEKTAFDLLRDELVACRRPASREVAHAAARALARIPQPGSAGVKAKISGSRVLFSRKDAPTLPGTLLLPKTGGGRPVLAVSMSGGRPLKKKIDEYLSQGSPVLVLDLLATGEIGAMKHDYYGARNRDEEVGVMLYMLGRSLVGERAGEIAEACTWLRKEYSLEPLVLAHGRMAIPAAHAKTVAPRVVADVVNVDPPPSWRKMVESGSGCPYADLVNGALREYDWTDL